MRTKDLKSFVDTFCHKDYPLQDRNVVIAVKRIGQVGGTPSVGVKNIYAGIDWDSGKILIYPEKELMIADDELLKDRQKLVDRIGWLEYEKRGLQSEVRRLRKKLGLTDEFGDEDASSDRTN